jgi:hypothetical protein
MWSFGKADGHELVKRLRVTSNLPAAHSAAATMTQAAMQSGYIRIEIGSAARGPKSEEVGTSIAADRNNAALPRVGRAGMNGTSMANKIMETNVWL